MKLVKFKDLCTISRKDGVDKYDNEVVSTIYEGPCSYQEENAIVAQGVTIRRATLYIPKAIEARINDSVEIGNISAFIAHSSVIDMAISQESITKLELRRTIG